MNEYIICIPTFRRYSIINNLTLKMLTENNIDPNLIKIFVVEEELELYKSVILDKYEIIVGKKGLVEQREFIENYFAPETNIVFLDDDIKNVDISLMSGVSSLDEFFRMAFREAIINKCYIWSVYPVFNKYFREKRNRLSNCLNICIGAFYGIVNRPNDSELKIKVTRSGDKEDVERTILYYKKDGLIHRYNKVGFETKYYGSIGGLGTLKERLPFIIERTNDLLVEYPTYGKLKVRKNGIYEFVLNKREVKPKEKKITKAKAKAKDTNDSITITEEDRPVYLDGLNDLDEYVEVYNALEEYPLTMLAGKSGRAMSFGQHRAVVLGYVIARVTRKYQLSRESKLRPKLYEAVMKLGKKICPFEFQAIQINHNLTCPRHKDRGNYGKSVIVSLGDYEGSNLVVEGYDEYDTNCRPLMFDGGKFFHYNTPKISGNKYSLVFFSNKQAKAFEANLPLVEEKSE